MWNQGNSSRWQVKVGYVFSSGFLATSVQEEEIKREVETIKKHIGRILNLPRQSQKRQIGRKNFPNKSLNVRS